MGKAAQATAAAAKWKTGRALITALGSASKAKKATATVKASKAVIQVTQAAEGAVQLISETIPYSVWSSIQNAKIPEEVAGLLPEEYRNEPLADAILDYLANLKIPFIDGNIESLKEGWNEIKREMESKRSDDQGEVNQPFEREQEAGYMPYNGLSEISNNINEQRYDMLLKRFDIK